MYIDCIYTVEVKQFDETVQTRQLDEMETRWSGALHAAVYRLSSVSPKPVLPMRSTASGA